VSNILAVFRSVPGGLDTERDPLIFSAALRYRVCPDIMTPAVGFAGLGAVLEFGAPRRN
jgi:hypothetical protein